MQKWLETAKSICNLYEVDNLSGQKAVLLEIFGLSLATLTAFNHQNKLELAQKLLSGKGSSFLPLARIKKDQPKNRPFGRRFGFNL